jgi:DNA-binding winged helix-turn-helix (wHTH) protein/tetratricopeptide (TPR) repeat protein
MGTKERPRVPLRLDLDTGEAWRGNEPVRLGAKALGVLRALVEHRGRLVTKDQLLAEVWRDVVVSEWALTTCIHEIRAALGDDPLRPRYIETVHRRGYRFVGPVDLARPAGLPLPVGPRASSAPGGGSPILEVPLIGRQAELARLRRAMEDARGGQARLVLVTGEAGTGKTRLLEELAVEARRSHGLVLLGRCHESEQILPYRPWVDALRDQATRDANAWRTLAPIWRDELARVLPELGPAKPRLSLAPEDHVRLFEAVARVVRHLATGQPVTLILEDLHWADEMSLRLLASVRRRLARGSVLMLGSVREEEIAETSCLSRVLRELDRERLLERVTLASLSRSDTLSLAGAVAGGGSGASLVSRLGEQLWEASHGNPLMVVETVRALREGEAVPASTSLPLPQRVRDTIVGRLERLSPRGQLMAEVAAVIGREFDFALLQRAAGLEPGAAAEGVGELVDRRILHVIGDQLDFTHHRIREATYSRLLPPRRKLLHGAVATSLEALDAESPEAHCAALGLHYAKAENWPGALTHLRQAGTLAAARSANREAVACFEHALAVLRHLPETREVIQQAIDLRFDLRHATPLGEPERVHKNLQEAEAQAVALGDQRRLGWAYVYLTNLRWWMGDSAGAVEAGRHAATIAAAEKDLGLRVNTNLRLGQAYYLAGDYREAIRWLEPNVVLLGGELAREPFGQSALPSVVSREYLNRSLAELGRFPEAVAHGREALRIAAAADHVYSQAIARAGLGGAHLRKGDVLEALPLLEGGLSLCRSRDLWIVFPYMASLLGWAYQLSDRVAEALPLLEQAVEQGSAMKRADHQWFGLAHLGEAYLRAGRREDAVDVAERALTLARNHPQRGCEAWTLRLLGEIAAEDAAGAQAAEAYYREALGLAQALGMRPLSAHCHLGLGRLHLRAEVRAATEEHLNAATAMLAEMGMHLWLHAAEAEWRACAGSAPRSRRSPAAGS